jgi:ferredoxin
MVNATYADEGSVDSCYWCATCLEYVRRYFEYGDEVSEHEIYENDPDGWEGIRKELNK